MYVSNTTQYTRQSHVDQLECRKLRCSGTPAAVGVQVPLGPAARTPRTRAAVTGVRAAELALRAAEAELASAVAADRADRAALRVEGAEWRGGGLTAATPPSAGSGADAAAEARAQRAVRRGEGGATTPAAVQRLPAAQSPVHDRAQRLLARRGGDRGVSAVGGSRALPLSPARSGGGNGGQGTAGCAALSGPVTEVLGGGWSKITTFRLRERRTDAVYVLKNGGAEGGGDLVLRSEVLMKAEIASRRMHT
jgi:hypothetical protein